MRLFLSSDLENDAATKLPDLLENLSALPNSYNSQKPTKLLIHGFWDTFDSEWIQKMTNMYHKYYDVNVISVSWSSSDFDKLLHLQYAKSLSNTRIVGEILTQYIEKFNFDLTNLHCIGHSLGAHICGYIGKNLKRSGKILDRITGLDPAGPGFSEYSENVRLDKHDADYVDVIHTHGLVEDSLEFFTYGTLKVMGDADFYPNFGHTQPGCNPTFTDYTVCNHLRACDLYTASLDKSACENYSYLCEDETEFENGDCQFIGPELARIGEFSRNDIRKTNGTLKFYSRTLDQYPYCTSLLL